MALSNDPTKKTPQILIDVLLKLKRVTQETINVAELAQVMAITETAGLKQYKCELLNNANVTVICIAVNEVTITLGTRVIIVFCDTDFRANLRRIKANKLQVETASDTLHSTSYGVIVGTI